MGRRETPVPDGPLREFAADLRELRTNAPGTPTYRELARKANYSPSVLSRAAAGHTLPTLDVTLAFVAACGGDVEEWRRRWTRLHVTLQRAYPDLISEADEPRDAADGPGEPTPPDDTATGGTAAAGAATGRVTGGRLLVVAAVAALAAAVALAVASPWSSEAKHRVAPPSSAAPSPTSAYDPVYLDRRLPLPDYNFYFDLQTGVVAEGDGPWSMSTNSGGDGHGAFEIPDGTDVYISPEPSLTPDRCAAQASPAPSYGVRFRRVPPGTLFCLRSRGTGAIALIRVIETDDGNYAAKISLDYYQRRR
ncbi:helix-turn-helix transcriptional regulator [Microbispora sp. NPDC046933]|uniref:helix-turn-helix domain-containing protein n=1 Tax=Microbispora sp. NPDC046933 TaxID=3155618 RepID=UPI0033F75D7E